MQPVADSASRATLSELGSRVRAWRAPDLALVQPVVFFLGSTETRPVPIDLARFTKRGRGGSGA